MKLEEEEEVVDLEALSMLDSMDVNVWVDPSWLLSRFES